MKNALSSVVFSVTHTVAGLALLLVSSWFIAACAVAGVQFNYMLPAVMIRALALLRIGSGYADMWLSHRYLLKRLQHTRLKLFGQLTDQVAVESDAQVDALAYQSEHVASVWASWVGTNASAILTVFVCGLTLTIFAPFYSLWWLLISIGLLIIYATVLYQSVHAAQKINEVRCALQSQLRQHTDAAPLWHMQARLIAPSVAPLQKRLKAQQSRLDLANNSVLTVSLLSLLAALWLAPEALLGTPMLMLMPMMLFSLNDWFGRAMNAQQGLVNYIHGRKALSELTQNVSAKYRFDAPIEEVSLIQFAAQNTAMAEVNGNLSGPGICWVKGSSGCGKTRFLMALSGLIDYRGTRQCWQQNGAGILNDCLYIEQFPYCLSDTLRNNLRVANPDASDAELKRILHLVGLDTLGNLEEWLGTGGRQLSGGERKRLGLARACLSRCHWILIDEPFESLDGDNQARVTDCLNRLGQHKQVILTSHVFPSKLQQDQLIDFDNVTGHSVNIVNLVDCREHKEHSVEYVE